MFCGLSVNIHSIRDGFFLKVLLEIRTKMKNQKLRRFAKPRKKAELLLR